MLLGEPVEARVRVLSQESSLYGLALLVHSCGEELEHEQRAEAVDDEAAKSIRLRVNHAIGVGNGIELQQIAAQFNGVCNLADKPVGIDCFILIGGQDAD